MKQWQKIRTTSTILKTVVRLISLYNGIISIAKLNRQWYRQNQDDANRLWIKKKIITIDQVIGTGWDFFTYVMLCPCWRAWCKALSWHGFAEAFLLKKKKNNFCCSSCNFICRYPWKLIRTLIYELSLKSE